METNDNVLANQNSSDIGNGIYDVVCAYACPIPDNFNQPQNPFELTPDVINPGPFDKEEFKRLMDKIKEISENIGKLSVLNNTKEYSIKISNGVFNVEIDKLDSDVAEGIIELLKTHYEIEASTCQSEIDKLLK